MIKKYLATLILLVFVTLTIPAGSNPALLKVKVNGIRSTVSQGGFLLHDMTYGTP